MFNNIAEDLNLIGAIGREMILSIESENVQKMLSLYKVKGSLHYIRFVVNYILHKLSDFNQNRRFCVQVLLEKPTKCLKKGHFRINWDNEGLANDQENWTKPCNTELMCILEKRGKRKDNY